MGNNNQNFHLAKKNPRDEFYTEYKDIEKEVIKYIDQFEGKTIYCNCDDPQSSNFTKFFLNNFKRFKIKKLICTHFEENKPSYMLVAKEIDNGKIITEDTQMGKYKLSQNKEQQMNLFEKEGNIGEFSGDFRSPECIKLLKESDIVVTNPPFSLFEPFILQLIEYNKKFLILGEQSKYENKELFELVKKHKFWLGYDNGGNKWFRVPDSYSIKTSKREKIENGKKYISMGRIVWYTNLETTKRKEIYPFLTKKQNERNGIKYVKYDNYDALNVDCINDIPRDYDGIMGVPATFLKIYNPEQFEIIGHTHSGDKSEEVEKIRTSIKNRHRGFINGKQKSARVLIKHKLKYDELGNVIGGI